MATSIDNKIVEMKFDNSNFEKNAQKSIGTLEKLKQALKFDKSAESLEKLETASNKVNFSGMAKAVDQVSVKFSSLYAISTRVMERITDAAINAGVALAKNLSVDNIAEGWGKYETKVQSVQTIMAATGKSIDNVNSKVAELNWFTDETSYNLSDMVDNIGKFTSAGVDLDTATTAMQGIATWAAISGQNSAAASRVMYNLSQSLGQGALATVDWRSVELANMATQAFKENLLETAEAAGYLREVGKDAEGVMQYQYKVGEKFSKDLKENIVTYKNFRETLSDKWVTNDVLMGVLNEYGNYSNIVREITDAKEWDNATYTMKRINDVMANGNFTGTAEDFAKISADLDDIGSDVAEKLYKAYNSVGKEAFEAAQEAKTLTDAINATKDAVGTSWSNMFEKIFGDYEDAKRLWTPVTQELWNIFASGLSDANDIIESALYNRLSWRSITEKMKDAGATVGDAVINGLNVKGIETALKNVLTNNTLLDASGKRLDYDELVREYGSLEKSLERGWLTADIFKMTMQELGATENEAADATEYFSEELEKLGKVGGRQLLLESLANAYNYIKMIFTSISDAWNELFGMDAKDTFIYNLITKFHEFTSNLDMSEEKAESLKNIFITIFTPIKKVTTLIGDIASKLWEIAKRFLPTIKSVLTTVLGLAGKIVSTVINLIADIYDFFSKNIEQAWTEFKSSDLYTGITELFGNIKTNVSEFIGSISNTLKENGITSAFDLISKPFQAIYDFATEIAGGPIGTVVAKTINNIFSSIASGLNEVKTMKLEDFINVFNKFGDLLRQFVGFGKGTVLGVSDMVENFFGKMKAIFQSETLSFWEKNGNAILTVVDFMIKLAKRLYDFVTTNGSIAVDKLKNALQSIEVFVAWLAVTKAIWSAGTMMRQLGLLFKAIRKKVDPGSGLEGILESAAKVVLAIIALLAAINLSLKILGEMDPNKVKRALTYLAGVFAIVGLMLLALAWINKKYSVGSKTKLQTSALSVQIIAIAAAIGMIVNALEKLQNVNLSVGQIAQFVIVVGSLITAMYAMSHLGGDKNMFANAFAITAFVAALTQILTVIESYSKFDWKANQKGILAVIAIMFTLAKAVNVMSKGLTSETNAAGFGTIIGLVLGLMVVGHLIEDLGKLPTEVLLRGGIAVSAIMAGIAIFAYYMKKNSVTPTVLNKGQHALTQFAGIATLIITTSAAIYVLGRMDLWSLTKGIAAAGLILAGIAMFMKSINGFAMNAKGIAGVAIALVGITTIIVLIGFIIDTFMKAGADKAVKVGLMLAAVFTSIALLAVPLSVLSSMSALAIAKGIAAIIAISLGATAAIAAITGVVTAIGAFINSHGGIDGVKKDFEAGKEFFVMFADLIGSMIGALVGGAIGIITDQLCDSMDKLGIAFGKLSESSSAFFDAIRDSTAEDEVRAKYFGKAIGNFVKELPDVFPSGKVGTVESIAEAINSFFEHSEKSLIKFGELDDKTVTGLNGFGNIVSGFGTIFENDITSLTAPQVDAAMETFNSFASGVVDFIENMKDIDDSGVAKLDTFKTVCLSLSEIRGYFTNDNGLLGEIFGGNSQSWDEISAGLYGFGWAVTKFSEAISGFKDPGQTILDGISSTADVLGHIKTTLKDSSWWNEVFGNGSTMSWSDIGSGLADFGIAISGFAQNISGVTDVAQLAAVGDAIKSLADAKASIQVSSVSWYDLIMNDNESRDLNKMFDSLIAMSSKNLSAAISTVNACRTIMSILIGIGREYGPQTVDATANIKGFVNNLVDIYNTDIDSIGLYNKFVDAGEHMASGFAQGIKNGREIVESAAISMAMKAITSAKKTLDEHSPSKVFFEIGDYVTQGFVGGIKSDINSASFAGSLLGATAISGVHTAADAISSILTSGIESTPTIRPVVDLTDVSNSSRAIASMMASDYSSALSGKGLSNSLSHSIEIQNGNSNVVSAISSIKSDITRLNDSMAKMKVVMDNGALVGEISVGVDKALGQINKYKTRGN